VVRLAASCVELLTRFTPNTSRSVGYSYELHSCGWHELMADETDGESTPDDKTVQFLWDQLKGAPDRIVGQITSLDGKGVQVFAAATVLIGFSGTVSVQASTRCAQVILLFAALLAYIVTVLSVAWQLRPQRIRGATWAGTLWTKYKDRQVPEIQSELARKVEEDAPANRAVVKAKRIALVIAFGGAATEAVLIAVNLIISRVAA